MSDKPASAVTQSFLFGVDPTAVPAAPACSEEARGTVRLRRANRAQRIWGPIDVDAQLPEDDPVRAISAVIERLDLSALYAQVQAYQGLAGAPAIDPKILLALWVYGTSEGEGSAREIWRLTRLHAAYRWICGGVQVGYHTLSDFRSQQQEVIDALITQVLAILMAQNLVELSRVAQDGTRVRASAGAASPGGSDTRSTRSRHQRAAESGAAARRHAAPGATRSRHRADPRGNRDEEAQRCQGQYGPRLDHRSRRQSHEDG